MREIVFDTETTGTRPDLGHRIVELGAVELIDGKIGRTAQWYFNPERPVDAGAYEVHGLSDDFLARKPLFRDCFADILGFFGDSPLIAHNAEFDRNFLNHELKLVDYPPLSGNRFVDTLRLSRQRFKSGRHSLDALCARFDVDNSDRNLHGALKDSELLAQVYIQMIHGHQQEIRWESQKTSENKENATKTIKSQTRFHQRTVSPLSLDDAEIAAHKEFLQTSIPNALWLHTEQKPLENS